MRTLNDLFKSLRGVFPEACLDERKQLLTRGVYYVVDNLYGFDSALDFRNSYILYNGRFDPYPACGCSYSGAASCHSGSESSVIKANLE